MAIIKSYTDISQSKVLSKILPLESADMRYDGVMLELKIPKVRYNDIGTPCWSLASLLGVLPNGIVMNKDSQNGKYHFSSKYIETYVTADNPIDACYELILKLHELNLL